MHAGQFWDSSGQLISASKTWRTTKATIGSGVFTGAPYATQQSFELVTSSSPPTTDHLPKVSEQGKKHSGIRKKPSRSRQNAFCRIVIVLYTSLERLGDIFVFWYALLTSTCSWGDNLQQPDHSLQASVVLGNQNRNGVLLGVCKWHRVPL